MKMKNEKQGDHCRLCGKLLQQVKGFEDIFDLYRGQITCGDCLENMFNPKEKKKEKGDD